MADYNGDGRLDIASYVFHYNDNSDRVEIYLQQAGTTFSRSGQTAFVSDGTLYQIEAGDHNHDGRPDVAGVSYDSGTLFVGSNTSSGSFPGCTPPGPIGIALCSSNSASTGHVRFDVAARWWAGIRRLEVWVDGAKRIQTYNSYATYAFMDQAISLAAGAHRVAIYAVGFDNRLQRRDATITVGGGSTCANPASPGVTVCSPVHNSLVNSPVRALASATVSGTLARFELWVDGDKKFTTTMGNMDVNVPMPAGTHRFSFVAVNTAKTLWKTSVNVTVQ